MDRVSNGAPARRPQKTAKLLAERIVADIIDRNWRPGTRLPPENEMISQYRVGRGSLREALRFLELQGVLTIRQGPHGGPVVSEVDSRALAGNLALCLALDRTPFSAILEVRRTLEPTLAAKSAAATDERDLRALEQSIEAMAAQPTNQRAVVLENRRFHDLIAKRAGNPVFAHLVNALNWIIDGAALGVHFPEAEVQATARAHRLIYDAIAARDPERARNAMEKHLQEFTAFLKQRYPETLNVALRWESADDAY